MNKDELIFDIIEILSSKHPLSKNQKQNIITSILEGSEKDIEKWSVIVQAYKNQTNKLVSNLNSMHEDRLKRIEAGMKKSVEDLGIRIIFEGSTEDTLTKELEKIFGE